MYDGALCCESRWRNPFISSSNYMELYEFKFWGLVKSCSPTLTAVSILHYNCNIHSLLSLSHVLLCLCNITYRILFRTDYTPQNSLPKHININYCNINNCFNFCFRNSNSTLRIHTFHNQTTLSQSQADPLWPVLSLLL